MSYGGNLVVVLIGFKRYTCKKCNIALSILSRRAFKTLIEGEQNLLFRVTNLFIIGNDKS